MLHQVRPVTHLLRGGRPEAKLLSESDACVLELNRYVVFGGAASQLRFRLAYLHGGFLRLSWAALEQLVVFLELSNSGRVLVLDAHGGGACCHFATPLLLLVVV